MDYTITDLWAKTEDNKGLPIKKQGQPKLSLLSC